MERKLSSPGNQMLVVELHMDVLEEFEVEDITRQFAEATNLSLISVDSHGDIEFVNRSACHTL
jgi:ligand-binding sensor protein